MKRVVVTGIGSVTPLGIGSKPLWTAIRAGQSAVRKVNRFDTKDLNSKVAAAIEDFDPLDYMDAKMARRLDRFSLFAVASAGMALADAGYTVNRNDGYRIGTYIGSALGGVGNAEGEHKRLVQDGIRAVDRLIALSVFSGAGASNVSIAFGLKGPALSNANSCTSGTIAIGEAFRLIRSGGADLMLAGGSEAPLAPLCFGAFDLIGAMSVRNDSPEKASRPFDRHRDGFVMAEGAAVLLLEELEHAQRRNAKIYGELCGYGVTSDAHHMTIPRPDGQEAARSMRLALEEAQRSPEEIDYINAHGSSTLLNDKTETLAIKSVFGERAGRVPISATKAMHGHALGASGAIEASIGLLAMAENYVPPTINLENPDPECDLDYVPQKGRSQTINRFITQSFGFGGVNAALVFNRHSLS